MVPHPGQAEPGRVQAQLLDRGAGEQRVQGVDRGRRHQLVVGEPDAGHRGGHPGGPVTDPGHVDLEVPGGQAPPAPLAHDRGRHVADDPETATGEVAGGRDGRRDHGPPEHRGAPADGRHVVPPVAVAAGHRDDLVDQPVMGERQDLGAQAVPEPGDGQPVGPLHQGLQRAGGIARPAQDVAPLGSQLGPPAGAAVVERQGQEPGLGEPGGQRPVERGRGGHGRDQQDRTAGVAGGEPGRAQQPAVVGGDRLVITSVIESHEGRI